MNRINVQVEIPEAMENFINLLPLNIRKQYVSSITSAILKQNEKQIIENVQSIVQSIMSIAISQKDEKIMQEELDKALSELAVIVPTDKKTIKGKKNKEDGLKKSNIVADEDEIQPTILTTDVSDTVDFIESQEAKDSKKGNVLGNEHLNLGLDKKDKMDNDIKKFDLGQMFNDR